MLRPRRPVPAGFDFADDGHPRAGRRRAAISAWHLHSRGQKCLVAAGMLGVTEVYRVGGAQAIAALAYGTETIARVDKIVGPGNLYVTAAKKLVCVRLFDRLSLPVQPKFWSLVIRGNPEFIAADLVAQAEHDPESLALFITTRIELAQSSSASDEEIQRKTTWSHGSLCNRMACIFVADSRSPEL